MERSIESLKDQLIMKDEERMIFEEEKLIDTSFSYIIDIPPTRVNRWNRNDRVSKFDKIEDAKNAWRPLASRSYDRLSDGFAYFILEGGLTEADLN